ncbi:MAG: TerC/Alx family metal homeostasis membrane protein [Bacteroidia bacterium]|nr:TerC/Alx family metal homeostasis membrane protein [Bacteroidia bacterium]MDW8159474.1 TerC/Alx family metal homeostasis membrane protein [Bacteroidia bacterium]
MLLFIPEYWLWGLFSAVIITFLIFDLGIIHKNPKVITFQAAVNQSIFWIAIALSFCLILYFYYEPPGKLTSTDAAVSYLTAYLIEKALSMDNIFVILLILRTFKIEEEYHHEVLFWGVLGAIVMRLIFILLGKFFVSQGEFVLWIFGAILVYTGFKMLFFNHKQEEGPDPEKNLILRFARSYLRITGEPHKGKLILFKEGKLYFTKLFLVILLIESTDLIFAIDSIPAAFSVSTDIMVLYTSNIFAVMGLRAMFFVLSNIIHKFHLLSYGLSLVLLFIGGKMLYTPLIEGLQHFNILNQNVETHISPVISLIITLTLLGGAIILSILIPPKN